MRICETMIIILTIIMASLSSHYHCHYAFIIINTVCSVSQTAWYTLNELWFGNIFRHHEYASQLPFRFARCCVVWLQFEYESICVVSEICVVTRRIHWSNDDALSMKQTFCIMAVIIFAIFFLMKKIATISVTIICLTTEIKNTILINIINRLIQNKSDLSYQLSYHQNLNDLIYHRNDRNCCAYYQDHYSLLHCYYYHCLFPYSLYHHLADTRSNTLRSCINITITLTLLPCVLPTLWRLWLHIIATLAL